MLLAKKFNNAHPFINLYSNAIAGIVHHIKHYECQM